MLVTSLVLSCWTVVTPMLHSTKSHQCPSKSLEQCSMTNFPIIKEKPCQNYTGFPFYKIWIQALSFAKLSYLKLPLCTPFLILFNSILHPIRSTHLLTPNRLESLDRKRNFKDSVYFPILALSHGINFPSLSSIPHLSIESTDLCNLCVGGIVWMCVFL